MKKGHNGLDTASAMALAEHAGVEFFDRTWKPDGVVKLP
jgi:hypothetical protein